MLFKILIIGDTIANRDNEILSCRKYLETYITDVKQNNSNDFNSQSEFAKIKRSSDSN